MSILTHGSKETHEILAAGGTADISGGTSAVAPGRAACTSKVALAGPSQCPGAEKQQGVSRWGSANGPWCLYDLMGSH